MTQNILCGNMHPFIHPSVHPSSHLRRLDYSEDGLDIIAVHQSAVHLVVQPLPAATAATSIKTETFRFFPDGGTAGGSRVSLASVFFFILSRCCLLAVLLLLSDLKDLMKVR